MAASQTMDLDLGWKAADFDLLGADGHRYTLEKIRGPRGTLVIFMCNHCPYVKAALDMIIADVRGLTAMGIGTVAIMPNDVEAYPGDSLENMAKLAEDMHLPFPYVIDETQAAAKAYGAVCTPEFYGFNADLELKYHGRIAEFSHLQPVANAKHEMFDALAMIAATGEGPADQKPCMGCSIKWRE
ncbi:MAG TPA: thioredoxin family protein [Alphaproteobacteria bacterium]|nr:thioredoxin family protein [Alphaproteobacteria bacterium]